MLKLRNLFTIMAATAVLMAGEANATEFTGISITDVNVKNQGVTATVAPGETFGVSATYAFLKPRAKYSIVQIIVGYDGIGAQVCIANGLVGADGHYYDHHPLYFRGVKKDITKQTVNFAMVAPEEPGVYEIRFRYAQAYLPEDAVKHWWNIDVTPPAEATIATIVVE